MKTDVIIFRPKGARGKRGQWQQKKVGAMGENHWTGAMALSATTGLPLGDEDPSK